MKVNVTSSAGPFVVNAPNSPVSWVVGSNQSVTWAVAGTTANNVNAAFVDIFLSTDGGYNYPIQLASKVPNNGTATITVPNNPGASNRIMVKGYKHVFFDISNANFAITAPTSSFAIAYNGVAEQQNKQACQGGSAVYTMPYTAYAGFTGTTTFTATGLPAGVTATFVPSTLSASGTVTMTVSATNNATPALVPMTISATSGATVKTSTFYFEIFNSNFGTQALTSPADLATTLDPLTLVLSWPVNVSATSYDVQIATNANFSTIVRNANVTTNSFSPTGLLNATIYYWRVLPNSPSCSGTYSAVYRFTTGQLTCITEISTDTPVEIPIVANTTPFISSMTLVSTNLVTDVNVTVDISHTWVNDMTISLISPSGTEIQLVSRPCTNASLLDITATFDDSGNTLVCATNPAISGTVKPLQLLSGFNGQPINGVWKLKVLDPYNEDGGAINSWSLNVCSLSQAVLATVDNSLSNFVLYPNPNKGNFTVQFNSTSSNEIGISVHDMRGRLIMNNTYTNTGLFSQNVELVNVQAGVYRVTVQDGNKKVVKRIVIE
jgi:subtilisin-like proprotein convertase family protein